MSDRPKQEDTVVDILQKYYLQKLKNNLISERTYVIYQNIIFILQKNLINAPIQSLQVQDIENLSDNIRCYSNETITKIWNCLKFTFKLAYNRRIIDYNIMLDDTLMKPNSNKLSSPVEALTLTEQTQLITILKKELSQNSKYQLHIYACLLCLYTGMRIGEALALCQDAINLDNNTITVKRTLTTNTQGKIYLNPHTKSYKSNKNADSGKRTFFMYPQVQEIVIDLLENSSSETPNGILFWNSQKNSYLSSNEVNYYLQAINKKYSIISGRLHSHILRHTFITRCVESGVNLKVIQYLVGHTKNSTLTLDIYTSISSDFIHQELQKLISQ